MAVSLPSHPIAGLCGLAPSLVTFAAVEGSTVPYVAQRAGSDDCGIAACATVTGLSYEALVEAVGFSSKGRGVSMLELAAPLFSLGFALCPLVPHGAKLASGSMLRLAEADAIKALIRDRDAVLIVEAGDASGLHAIAYCKGRVIDCGLGEIDLTLDEVPLQAAVLLYPLGEAA